MAVRDFDGTANAVITLTAPSYFSGPFTIAAVVNRDATSAYHTVVSIGPPGAGNPSVVFEFTDAGGLELFNFGGGVSANQNDSDLAYGTGWRLVAVTFDDVSIHRMHSFDGTTWGHSPASQAAGSFASDPQDWTALSPVLRFGQWNNAFNFFDGKIAMVALNIGSGLSDGQLEALAGGSRNSYAAAGFDHLWELNQESTATAVEDYIGSLDQTALGSGTSVVTDNDPPGSIFSGPWPPVGSEDARQKLRVVQSNLRLA